MARLESFYVKIRQEVQVAATEAEALGRAPRAVPITVRQLEAIVRISESVARMRLSDIATDDDVQTAIHMFTVSTLRAAKYASTSHPCPARPPGPTARPHTPLGPHPPRRMGDIELEGESGAAEHTAEEMIRKRVQIYMVVPKQRLLQDLNAQGIDMAAANRAVSALVRQREFEEVAQGKKVKRLR